MTEIQHVSDLTRLIQNPQKASRSVKRKSSTTTSTYEDPRTEPTVAGTSPFREETIGQTTTPSYNPVRGNPTATAPPTTPQQPFLSAMDLFRSQHKASQIPSTGATPPADVMRNVGKTQLEKHAVRMRQMAKALEASHNKPSHKHRAIPVRNVPNSGYIAPTHPIMQSSSSSSSWRQSAMDRLIGSLRSQHPMQEEMDVDVNRELDRDVARALVYLGGKAMGVPPEDLFKSPGLQKLVARNTQWFQRSPDWFKLLGLCAAKKFNCYLQTHVLPIPDYDVCCSFVNNPSPPTSSSTPTTKTEDEKPMAVPVVEEEEEPAVPESTASSSSTSAPLPPTAAPKKRKREENEEEQKEAEESKKLNKKPKTKKKKEDHVPLINDEGDHEDSNHSE